MAPLRTQTFFTLGLVAHLFAILFVSLYSMMGDEGHVFRVDAMETDFNRDMIFNYIAVFTIVILYISFSMKLTWPMRIEEALIIILIWSLLGNLGVGFVHHGPVCEPEPDLDDEPPHHPTHHHTISENDVPLPTVAASVPPDKHVTVHGIEDDGAKNHKREPVSIMSSLRSPCGFNIFNIYFSLLCIVSSMISFLCDTKNYCFSFMCRALSIILAILIFLVPIACNRFQLMSIEVLVLKITLYNIVWNMNRFKRITEDDIGDNYAKALEIMKNYIPGAQNQKAVSMPRPRRRYANEEERETAERLRELSHTVREPSQIFHQVATMSAVLRKRPQAGGGGGRPPPRTEHLPTRQEVQRPYQISQFEQLSKINRKYSSYCFFSWKNRSYNDRIIYLIDLSRTIWILAICPIYLFLVLLFLLWLAYYIRINISELEDTNKTLSVMNRLYKGVDDEDEDDDDDGEDDYYADDDIYYG